MKPQTTSAKTPSKIKLLNKPLHTRTGDGMTQDRLADEPSEVTCPIVRETL